MRKRIAAKSTRIPPVRFHLEDLTELVAVFNKYCETVEISDDKAIYDSLSEAAGKVTSPVTNLEIAGKNPGVILSLKSGGSWLTQRFEKTVLNDAESDQYDLAFTKIKEFLDRYRPAGLILSGPFPTLTVLAVIVTVAVVVGLHNPERYGGYAFFGAWILAVAWLALVRTLYMDIGAVSLKPKGAVTTFWGRNGDKVWLLLLGAAVGICGTLITEWLKTYIRSK